MSSAEAASDGAAGPLPLPIANTLRQLIRRRRRAILLRGLLVAGAVPIAAIHCALVISYFPIRNPRESVTECCGSS